MKFEEDNWKQSIPSLDDETPRIIKLVIKLSGGAIKEERQSEYVLLAFVLLAIGVSIYLLIGIKSSPKPTERSITGAPLEKTSQE